MQVGSPVRRRDRLPDGQLVRANPNPKPRQRHYQGQVDAFAVDCPRTAGVYLIPLADVPREEATLRIDPPRNGQSKLNRFAADYAIAKIDVELETGNRRVA